MKIEMRRMLIIPVATAMLALSPGLVRAQAACVAKPGERFDQVSELGAWERSRIGALAPEGPARLFLGECGLGCVAGIDHPRASYDAAFEAGAEALTVVLSAGGRERGRLVFDWPEAYEWFGADTEPGNVSGGDLYTEMRLRGTVSGSGDLGRARAVPAELVLSGFGNRCVTARSFSGWSLSVAGEGVRYRLFGGLKGAGKIIPK